VTATTDTGELPTVSTDIPTAPVDPAPAGGAAAMPVDPAPAVAPGTTIGIGRLQSLSTRRLTAPGGIALAVLVVAPGVLLDLAFGGTFGAASSVTFVAACVAAPLAVRRRALATAAVLPPLLFVAAVAILAGLSGNNDGNRELVLDIGTTLAISAPVLFGGTVAALAVVLGRLLVPLLRR